LRLILPSRAFRARKRRGKRRWCGVRKHKSGQGNVMHECKPIGCDSQPSPSGRAVQCRPRPVQTQALCPCEGVGSSMAGLNSQGVSSATSLCRCGGFGCSVTGRTSQGAPSAISPGFPQGHWLLPGCVHLVPCACGGFGCPWPGAPSAP